MIIRYLLFILALALVICIFWFRTQAARLVSPDVIIVTPIISNATSMFDLTRINDFTADFDGLVDASYISGQVVESGVRAAFANVIITGQDYFHMHYLQFIVGGSWRDGDYAAVICEHLAWLLFGSTNVAGLAINMGDVTYDITGVVRGHQFRDMTAGGFAWVYRGNEARAITVYMRPQSYNQLTAHLSAINMLEEVGQHRQNYIITDMNSFIESFSIRGYILLFLVGLCFITLIIKEIIYFARRAGTKAEWTVVLLLVSALLVVIVLLLSNISVEFWLPSFAEDGMHGYMQLIFNVNLLTPRQYLSGYLSELLVWNLRGNIAFGVGAVAAISACILINTKK